MQHYPKNLSHCRFCGKFEKMDHLLDFSNDKQMFQDYVYKIGFIKLDFINLNCNLLPKTVCEVCYNFLQECFDFFHKMKEAQLNLLNIYKHGEVCSQQMDIKIENDHVSLGPEWCLDFDKKVEELNVTKTATQNQRDIKIKIQEWDTKKPKTDTRNNSAKFKHKIKKIKTTPGKHLEPTTLSVLSTSTDNLIINSTADKNIFIEEETSWTDYEWLCMHCQAKFNSMSEVRDHSKVVHSICFAFQCNDCTEVFNYFNPFMEHVREHRKSLRFYCPFCHLKSATAAETMQHSLTHWSVSHICTMCGEMLSNAAALDRHNKVYKRAALPQRYYKRRPKKVAGFISWREYDWSCQDCSLKLPNIASLRAHTRETHGKCFAMKCADCLSVLANYKQFVEHVTAHRKCLKSFCPYCNAQLSESDVSSHIYIHMKDPRKPCLGCGEIFPDSFSLSEHQTRYDAPRVRGSKDSEGLTCGVCDKKFPNAFQLKNHKVIHKEKRERDQVCESCGKAFFDVKTLTNHIKTHSNKTETCEICKKTFLTAQRLKVHISTHLEMKQFVCDDCGKKFRRKSQLRLHLASHSDVQPFQCGACGKRFRLQSYLKIHERQHTGARPYTCEVCQETFNHWGNCNRHMIRKHGVTFAKTKITAQGKLDINRKTGETKKIDMTDKVSWCNEMLKPKKRGRKKKVPC